MSQLDFWNESCPECDAGIPFAHPVYSVGYQSHWMNWRDGFSETYRLRICIRGVPKPTGGVSA
jgi:hypothetical protein